MKRETLEKLEQMDWRIECTDLACQVLNLDDVYTALWRHLAAVYEATEQLPTRYNRVVRSASRDRHARAFWIVSGFRCGETLVLLPSEL